MKKIGSMIAGVGLALAFAAQASAESGLRPTIGLAKAVSLAESGLDAKAFDAELDAGRAGLVYEISLVKDGAAMQADIDAVTGKIVRQTYPSKVKLPWKGEDLKAAQTSPKTLTETIAMVEEATKGQVSEIGLERHKGRHYYEVELLGAEDRVILVDMRTGAFTPLIDD